MGRLPSIYIIGLQGDRLPDICLVDGRAIDEVWTPMDHDWFIVRRLPKLPGALKQRGCTTCIDRTMQKLNPGIG
jgi:hypothetical protein